MRGDDEKIGFHKGSLMTLTKEREELLKIINICDQLIKMHVQSLKDLGIDLVANAKKEQESIKKKSLDDQLRK